MGNYAVPENIRKMKPKGTMVKRIKDSYYVYTFKNYIDENGKRKTKTIKCIGKIEEDNGFVPNANYLKKAKLNCFEFGQYAFSFASSVSVLDKLTSFFNPQDALRIFTISLIQVVNKYTEILPLCEDIKQSYLDVYYPELCCNEKVILSLLDNLARNQTFMNNFQQSLIKKAEFITFDVNIIKTSNSHLSNERSYISPFDKEDETQMILVTGYNAKTRTPIFSRMIYGKEKIDENICEILKLYDYSSSTFVIDERMVTDEGIKTLQEKHFNYIVRLNEDDKDYIEITKSQDLKKHFIYERDKENPNVVDYKEKEKEGEWILFFKNLNENTTDQGIYTQNILREIDGYTEENFEKLSPWFGTCVLKTTLKTNTIDAKDIYSLYQNRSVKNTFLSSLKKDSVYTDLSDDFYEIQGYSFITLVSSLIYEELKKVESKFNGKSIYQILNETKKMKLGFHNGHYQYYNQTKEIDNYFKKIDFDYLSILKTLDDRLAKKNK